MSKQSDKYHLSLSGEYFVAAELQRRNVSAAVTYGNAKKADIVAFNDAGDKVTVIEVKTTGQSRWVVGSRTPEKSDKLWVFVRIPKEDKRPASYYVLTQTEIHDTLMPIEEEYQRKYREKHGEDYGDRAGVCNLSLKQAEPHRDAWYKIVEQLQ
jgi:hypothetical protein